MHTYYFQNNENEMPHSKKKLKSYYFKRHRKTFNTIQQL